MCYANKLLPMIALQLLLLKYNFFLLNTFLCVVVGVIPEMQQLTHTLVNSSRP